MTTIAINIPEEEWVNNIHSSLFHVEKTDLSDDYGVRLDQLIVIRAIGLKPEVLKYKTLKDWLKMFDVLD